MSTRCCMYNLIIVILSAAISVSCSASFPQKQRSNETDKTTLLALKDAFFWDERTPPDYNGVLSSWNSSVHFCQWRGVTCGNRHERVIAIRLSGEMLGGVVSPSIGNLTFLRYLLLEYNSLQGEIPREIGQLWSLSYLELKGNFFQGNIPVELSNCSNLVSLSIANNNLTGHIPSQFGSLSKLLQFDVSRNNLMGEMPNFFSNFSSLDILDLSENNFHGEIRDSLQGLSNLTSLSLSSNYFSGSIDSVTNCTKLTWFSLNDNKFNGSLPNSISNFTTNLEFLHVGENYITGAIPEGIGELSGLQLLLLSGNSLSSTIPNSVGKLTGLWELSLDGNKLHGGIPSSIGNLTSLFELVLSDNLLDGNFPTTLGNCKGIEFVDISRNQLGGKQPDEVFTLPQNLRYLSISYNSFKGKFPVSFENLVYLSTLDASYNNFSGEIPPQLGDTVQLEYLNMAGNSFEGFIPVSLGRLRTLIYLDLSNNNLSGPIPMEFASTAGLKNLNLSFNQLEGEVPLFKNASVVDVIGNKELCGGNLELLLPPCIQYHWKQEKTSLKKLLIAFTLSVLASFLLFAPLCIFIHRRRKYEKDDEDGSLTEGYPRVTYAKLFRATEGFKESNLIGTGYYGDVYKGIIFDEYETGLVAVKVLNLSKHGATKSFIGECKVLSRIRHRNLLRLITLCSSLDHKGNGFKALVYDFMSNGSLDNWLHLKDPPRGSRRRLSFAKRLEIAIDVGCALDYLHNDCETPIVHCDLKPSNILLDGDMVAHVGDFGLAKLLLGAPGNFNEGESMSTIRFKGTVGYIAPEYGMGALASPRGDTYSYGILLLELITGRRPTNDMFNDEMNLQSFSKRSLPDHVEEVVDRSLVNELHEAILGRQNAEQIKLQFHSFFVSFVEIGISCSADSSRDRMDIKSAVWCLKGLKEKYDRIVKPSIIRVP